MHTRAILAAAGFAGLLGIATPAGAQDSVTIRAATVLDGKGGVFHNAIVAVEGSRIVKVGDGAADAPT